MKHNVAVITRLHATTTATAIYTCKKKNSFFSPYFIPFRTLIFWFIPQIHCSATPLTFLAFCVDLPNLSQVGKNLIHQYIHWPERWPFLYSFTSFVCCFLLAKKPFKGKWQIFLYFPIYSCDWDLIDTTKRTDAACRWRFVDMCCRGLASLHMCTYVSMCQCRTLTAPRLLVELHRGVCFCSLFFCTNFVLWNLFLSWTNSSFLVSFEYSCWFDQMNQRIFWAMTFSQTFVMGTWKQKKRKEKVCLPLKSIHQTFLSQNWVLMHCIRKYSFKNG